jgi:uncharacterized membrane protein YkoI
MIRVRSIVALLLCASTLSAQARLLPDVQIERFAATLPVTFQSGGVSLEQAVAMVQSKYGAKVMRANSVEEDGRVVHYIRLMTPDRSRVWTVRVDAATGREF